MSDILTFTTPETRWLSNMAFVDIRHKGILYISTENFYQAMKFDETDLIRLNDMSESGCDSILNNYIGVPFE